MPMGTSSCLRAAPRHHRITSTPGTHSRPTAPPVGTQVCPTAPPVGTQVCTAAALLAAILIGGTTSVSAFDASCERRDQPSAIRFVSSDHSTCIRSDFRGGRLTRCVEFGSHEFDLLIRPECDPINDSAWYAFQVYATKPSTIQLRLRYEGGTHRYRPLISRDRITWHPLGEHLVSVSPDKTEAVMTLRVSEEPLWISAQELLDERDMMRWSESLMRRPYVSRQEIGRSVEQRPIEQLEITESDSPSYLFILSRQHPPEVSGTIGMMRFVEAITADTSLAHEFRKEFSTLVVPTSNPDGVANGHWRCNANGVDLNRDWGPFAQPETRAIARSLLRRRSLGRDSLWLVLDFHSTYEDVFYTAENVDEAFPQGFATTWFDAIGVRFPDYQVNHDATHNGNRTTSKSWVHQTLDVAAVTYEFGDNTDRDQIRKLAVGSAEEMMRLMLAAKRGESWDDRPAPTKLIGVQRSR